MDYAAHIARICKIEDIEVRSHSSGGRAWRKKRLIAIRPVKSAVTYAIALHEIGHILGPRQNGNAARQGSRRMGMGKGERAGVDGAHGASVILAKGPILHHVVRA